jgi:hypothetical protein
MTRASESAARRRLSGLRAGTLRPESPLPFAPDEDDAIREVVRGDTLGEAFELVRDAPAGPSGEAPRALFRSVVRACLDDAAREPLDEWRARVERGAYPPEGFEAAVLRAASPEEQSAIDAAWRRAVGELGGSREAFARSALETARSAGAAGLLDLVSREQSVEIATLVESFERVAIAPLDDRVAAATRGLCRSDPREIGSTELLRARWSVGDEPRIPRSSIARTMRRLGGWLGQDPDGRGPRLIEDLPAFAASRLMPTGERPEVVLGAVGGPVGLFRALEAFGRGCRAGFLRGARGSRAPWTDPAFPVAAGVLFRRLAFNPAFPKKAETPCDESMLGVLWLEESVDPRRAWSYLLIAHSGTAPDAVVPDSAFAADVLERALQRPATPDEAAAAREVDASGASGSVQ